MYAYVRADLPAVKGKCWLEEFSSQRGCGLSALTPPKVEELTPVNQLYPFFVLRLFVDS